MSKEFLDRLYDRMVLGGIDVERPQNNGAVRIQVGKEVVFRGFIQDGYFVEESSKLNSAKIESINQALLLSELQSDPKTSKLRDNRLIADFQSLKNLSIADLYDEYSDDIAEVFDLSNAPPPGVEFEYPSYSYMTVAEYLGHLELQPYIEGPSEMINIDIGGDRVFRYNGKTGQVEIDSFNPFRSDSPSEAIAQEPEVKEPEEAIAQEPEEPEVKEVEDIAYAITSEFDRLNVGTEVDPYSGLSADLAGYAEGKPVVKVFDDYASGFYLAEPLLQHLQELKPSDLDLDGEPFSDIWQHLHEFEFEGSHHELDSEGISPEERDELGASGDAQEPEPEEPEVKEPEEAIAQEPEEAIASPEGQDKVAQESVAEQSQSARILDKLETGIIDGFKSQAARIASVVANNIAETTDKAKEVLPEPVVQFLDKAADKVPAAAIALVELHDSLEEPAREWLLSRFEDIRESGLIQQLPEKGGEFVRASWVGVQQMGRAVRDRAIADSVVSLAKEFGALDEDRRFVYRAEAFTVRVEGLNHYSVENRKGQEILSFKYDRLTGPKEMQNRMSFADQVSFVQAGAVLTHDRISDLAVNTAEKLQHLSNALGNLAPEGAKQRVKAFCQKQVSAVAQMLLETDAAIESSTGQRVFTGNRFKFVKDSGAVQVFKNGMERQEKVFEQIGNTIKSRMSEPDMKFLIDFGKAFVKAHSADRAMPSRRNMEGLSVG